MGDTARLFEHDKTFKKRIADWLGVGGLGGIGRYGGGDRGLRPKKAYISKTTDPNLKNEHVLESA